MSNTNYVNYQVALIPGNAELINQLNELLITSEPAINFEKLKTAAKKAEKEHGKQWVMSTLKNKGIEVSATIGRSVSKIDEDQYTVFINLWSDGPVNTESQKPAEEDDGFDDDDGLGSGTPDVTAEAVKIALKAYSRNVGRIEAKDIMNDNGAKALSNVSECSAKQLAAMMSKLVE